MNENLELLQLAIAIGAGATLLMDLWAVLNRRMFGAPGLNWCFVGRWIGGIPNGRFVNDDIGAQPSIAGECALGWVAHYVVGVVFALGFLTVAGEAWLAAPALLPALLFGLATVVFPFLIMQPGLGAGIAGSRTPSPARARVRSLLTHSVYGLGLFLAGTVVSMA